MTKEKGLGFWIASIGMAALAVAMFTYLGYRTLDFLQLTFKEDQAILAWLGLFSTSLGALIWAAVYKWLAGSSFQRAVALIMVVVSLLGELALAAGDMLLTVQLRAGAQFTEGEMRSLVFAAAGLAALHGIALFAFELVEAESAGRKSTAPAGGFRSMPVQVPSIAAEAEQEKVPFGGGNGTKPRVL